MEYTFIEILDFVYYLAVIFLGSAFIIYAVYQLIFMNKKFTEGAIVAVFASYCIFVSIIKIILSLFNN